MTKKSIQPIVRELSEKEIQLIGGGSENSPPPPPSSAGADKFFKCMATKEPIKCLQK
jgi:hypothetical protein